MFLPPPCGEGPREGVCLCSRPRAGWTCLTEHRRADERPVWELQPPCRAEPWRAHASGTGSHVEIP